MAAKGKVRYLVAIGLEDIYATTPNSVAHGWGDGPAEALRAAVEMLDERHLGKKLRLTLSMRSADFLRYTTLGVVIFAQVSKPYVDFNVIQAVEKIATSFSG